MHIGQDARSLAPVTTPGTTRRLVAVVVITTGTIAAVVFVFWFGPTNLCRLLVAYFPKKPKLQHAVLASLLTTLSIVAATPLTIPLLLLVPMVFGFWTGYACNVAAYVISAIVCFCISRFACAEYFRTYVENHEDTRIRRMLIVFHSNGNELKFMFILRFLPGPLFVKNYLPGVLQVPLWFALLPATVHGAIFSAGFAMVGASMRIAVDAGGKEMPNWFQICGVAIAVAASLSLMYVSWAEYSKQLEKELEEQTPLLNGPEPRDN
eukprot:TRINITY_DN12397_c0_g1_i1.p1 TRINITY_DN12397_c0_g1~~TRINITY_DN12397_c0_g1_i1.p1  ORF type:complete len:265 (+),score=30.06 TRINITY_DN12397_c0_g1_i1:182-976(+)